MTWEGLSLAVVFVGSTLLSFVAIVAAWEIFCLLCSWRSVLAARSRLSSLHLSEEAFTSMCSRLATVQRQREELFEEWNSKPTTKRHEGLRVESIEISFPVAYPARYLGR